MSITYKAPTIMRTKRQELWGLLHAIIFVLIGSGIGAFLLALLADVDQSVGQAMQATGLALVFVAGLVMLIRELPRPMLFLRYLLSGFRSWVSKGVLSILLFLILGSIIFAAGGKSLLESPAGIGLVIIASLIGLFAMIYAGIVLASSSVLFWRTPLVPIIFLVGNSAGGLAILFLLHLFSSQASKTIARDLIVGTVLLLVANLIIVWWHVLSSSPILRSETIHLLTKGKLAGLFIVGVTVIGILIPIALIILALFAVPASSSYLLAFSALCILAGLIIHRYVLARSGFIVLWR